MKTGQALLRTISLALPYIAVILGLYIFHNAWLCIGIYHAGMIFILLLARKQGLARSLLVGWRLVPGVSSMVFGLLGGVLVLSLLPWLGLGQGLVTRLASLGLSGYAWPLFVFYHAMVNPWLEELFWRGFLGNRAGYPVTEDFLFAGYHVPVLALFLGWPWLIPAFGALFGSAWLWRWLARKCGGLAVPALSHLAGDSGVMIALWIVSLKFQNC